LAGVETAIVSDGPAFVYTERLSGSSGRSCGKYSYCYPPYARVLRLLRGLGCEGIADATTRVDRLEQSADIHNLLRRYLGEDRATFDGLFDLPLLRMAEDVDLRERVLGTTVPAFDLTADDEMEGPTC
jgi:hypothetical protein